MTLRLAFKDDLTQIASSDQSSPYVKVMTLGNRIEIKHAPFNGIAGSLQHRLNTRSFLPWNWSKSKTTAGKHF